MYGKLKPTEEHMLLPFLLVCYHHMYVPKSDWKSEGTIGSYFVFLGRLLSDRSVFPAERPPVSL